MNNKLPLPPSAEDFEDFFESSLCGFVITDREGKIARINRRAAGWLNTVPEELSGKRFSDILAVGGKIYFETHLWPLLRMQGYFDEVALELADSGNGKMPVYINGYERKDDNDQPLFIRFTVFRASDRRLYEENLQTAKQLAEANLEMEQQNALIREQFIAVLGHDLRNPLGGVMSAAQLVARSDLGAREEKLVKLIQTGSKRMHNMINDIMDLARGRLGGGFPVSPVETDLEQLLNQVSDELKVVWPERSIESDFNITQKVICDPGRLSQMASNLLANAIIHGSPVTPILIQAAVTEDIWEISVTNQGKPVPKEALPHLFHPFRREGKQKSQNGLGLGLYIASEIAKAHNGTLTVTSNEQQTCFTFRAHLLEMAMPYK
ncbi:PAS domain-containing sensor histidine kinase [Chryseobacterium sp. JJR-5R]|uniref:PAS domain-containing sensor histidine kinase n=1 Tax=Chryseobacterium sp. JJR-5R TaxID=3093923 RepID=UPI002A753EE3|nr:PAS domain-containing sensor histidine kinase [Chryseobacterium sp. JJR-5R]WPO81403.1 PAS domain-containing sensor histidine kinase [Chryseobacterium sp. JJR-5R]